MKKTSRLFAVAGAAFILSLWPAVSWSEFSISPSVSVREEYNDNIYLTRSHREDDFITTINPAINLRYKSNLLDLSLDYGLNFRFYAYNSKNNETSFSETQRAKLENTFSYKDILFLRVSDTYARVPIDTRRQVGIDNFISNMTDSNALNVNPYVRYPLTGTLWLNAGYQYQNLWYKAKEADNWSSHTFNFGLSKELTKNISTFVAYNYEIHMAEISDDYDRQSANVGISYQITPKIAVGGSMGKTWFDYDNRANMDSDIWDIHASYQVTPFVTLSAVHSLNFTNSVNLGTYKTKRTEGTVSYGGKVPLSLSVYKTTSEYLTTNRQDESKGITLASNVPIYLASNLTGNLTFNYSTLEVDTPGQPVATEEIDRYSAGLSLAYEMKITTLSIGYTWNWSDSSINNNDYYNNIVWVQARFAF